MKDLTIDEKLDYLEEIIEVLLENPPEDMTELENLVEEHSRLTNIEMMKQITEIVNKNV